MGLKSIIVAILCGFITIIVGLNDSKDLLLSLEEKNALEKFKPAVQNVIKEDFMKSDFYLIRWLRKAKLNVPNARSQLLQTIQWREKNNISRILNEDWSDMEEDYRMSFEGHDKQGRPVLTIDIGDWDLRAAVVQGKIRRLQRYLTSSTERNMQNIFKAQRDTGKPVTRSVVLVDSDGVNLRQHGCPLCISFLIQWNIEGESYYPGFNDETIIFNMPSVGAIILNAVRAVMSPEQSAQTKAFDSNKRIWMEYLDKRIERSERTQRYGGTKRD